MSTQQIFTIGTPCHEDWQQMTPTEKGRFCDACAKCVVDLTGKSQPEIQGLYREHGGNLCGSMPESQYASLQAGRTGVAHPVQRKNRWSSLHIFAAAFMLAFGLLWQAPAQAQRPIKGKVAVHRYPMLNGTVTLDGKPMAGVEMTFSSKFDSKTATTDAYGAYQVQLEAGAWTVSAYHADSDTETYTRITMDRGEVETMDLELAPVELMFGDVIEEIPIEEPRITGDTIVMHVPEPLIIDQPAPLRGNIEVVEVEATPTAPDPMIAGGIGPVPVAPEQLHIESLPEVTEVTDGTGAEKGAESMEVVIDDAHTRIMVKPVPATTEITVRIEASENAEAIELMLFDNAGKLLRTGVISGEAGSTTLMRVDDLPAGVYFLKGLREEYVFHRRILKM